MEQRSLSPRNWADLAIVALFWGGSFLAIRLALDSMGPHWVVALRCLGAFVLLLAVIRWRGLRLPTDGRSWAGFMALGLFNNAIPFTLITWAELTVPSGLASIINASTAIFGVVIAAMVLADERLTPRRLVGVLVGFAGVVIVIGPSLLGQIDLTSLAQLALVGAAISYAVSGPIGRRVGRGMAPVVVATGMLGCSALIGTVVAAATEGVPTMPTMTGALAILYLAAPSTALAYLIYYRLLATAGAGNTSLVTLLVAPIAVTLGALVLDEVLPLRAFAGFAAIGLGLLILDGRVLSHFRPRSLP
ncbi:DMT family transporter [Falsirhodobacter sp. 20TX0035]|uniref:DMT family transporter n=1 Tax=Falsirhodobacter sp. 20TX0035 TaxID=3022019 RepID=UPI00232B32EE|nr:DMT family transporter [Falsirhodobacter sp. 20TX0035]MDB6453113.1 DMT family transporter [Falsirhodobacter sp. 20TX0035]